MLRRWRPAVLKARLRRFLRDGDALEELRSWWPTIAATSLISSAAVVAAAIQTERFKNDLLASFATEKIAQIANDLTAEANDWAVWDETHRYLHGRNPAYFQRHFNRYSFARSPFLAAFDPQGRLVASAHFDRRQHRVVPLDPEAERQLSTLMPAGDPLSPLTFLARFEGRPYLMSAQPVRASSTSSAPAGRAASGRLLFVRPLNTGIQPWNAPQTAGSLQRALGIVAEHYRAPTEPASSHTAHHPLAPLQIQVPHPHWQGKAPLQQVIVRIPSERIAALQGIGGLLLGGLVLVVGLGAHSSLRHRANRFQTLRSEQARRRLNRDLAHRRSHDELTGLANEVGLAHAMADQRSQYRAFVQVLLVLDIDHFAVVNSGLGRAGGDAVLRAFGRHLQEVSHPTARVARLAADQFACGLVSTSDAALRSEVAALTQALNDVELHIEGHTVNITVSVGACMIGDDDLSQALHQASIACSLVKLAGGRGHQFFGDERASTLSYLEMQRMNEALVTAIKDKRISLHGQHAWRLNQGNHLPAVYVELLARICDPIDGSPFWSEPMIEAARFCGSLTLLDEHILALAFRQIASVQQDPALADSARQLVFAINITADTLLGSDLPARLSALLEQHQLDPGCICLELTEQAALRDPSAAIVRMHQLRHMGLKLSLDDFGTGTTSLGYLRDLPLDYVKIDKRFIWTLQEESTSRLIVQFVVELGKQIGFQTVAEGVEDLPLLRELKGLGISIAQGYITTRPRPFLEREPHWVFADAGDELLTETVRPR
ncbi:bifunctional diguanylate cyclase/phosphodiesterase [Synechococcus sp. FGCU-3]|nr:bifunctional diguanylate cyclase/phosphodiesterase [Synechococcus sp. FGCU3]